MPDPAGEHRANPWPPYQVVEPARERRSLLPAALVGLVVAAFGGLLGVLWHAVAPRLALIKAEAGFLYAETEPEQPVAADGWFAIIGAAAGVVFALLAWRLLRKYRGVCMLVGLTLGSLAGAVLAWYVGYKIGHAQFLAANGAAAVGERLDAPLELAMTNLDQRNLWKLFPTGVAAVQALFAAFTYTFLAGFSPYPDLRDEEPRDERHGSIDQFGPGVTGNSDNGMGTART
jgi:hypothetical protein